MMCNYILVYLDVFMIIIETQNRVNKNNRIQNGRKHHIQMTFSIEDKKCVQSNVSEPENFHIQWRYVYFQVPFLLICILIFYDFM